jgi:hypothetical protein
VIAEAAHPGRHIRETLRPQAVSNPRLSSALRAPASPEDGRIISADQSASRQSAAEMEAMRLAALVIVKKHGLVRYSFNPKVPKV